MTRFVAILLVSFAVACGAADPRVRLAGEWPPRAGDYVTVTQEWTRSAVLRGSYQEVMELSATLKSPEWHAAHAEKDAKNRGLVGEAKAQRIAQAQADAAGPYELELMVTTWDRRENDLDRGKKSVWRVVLLGPDGNEIVPLEIVRDKRPAFVVRSEFPAFGDFATAYIVRFPREANILGPDVKQVRLRISGERGGLQVNWDAP
ncbi:MAG: hypothetical protein IPQ07_35965 [Myxococcales bacterium]|nr:hypothetical protein [Myxococcales bacterium]